MSIRKLRREIELPPKRKIKLVLPRYEPPPEPSPQQCVICERMFPGWGETEPHFICGECRGSSGTNIWNLDIGCQDICWLLDARALARHLDNEARHGRPRTVDA